MHIDRSDPIFRLHGGLLLRRLGSHSAAKPTTTLFASCHGRTIAAYFATRRDLLENWNVNVVETNPIYIEWKQNKRNLFDNENLKGIFASTNVLMSYNMGARHTVIAIDNVIRLMPSDSKLITFVAPNCSCFWPVSYGYTGAIASFAAFDKGAKPDAVWSAFKAGEFDPMFQIRFRLEMGRLKDKESYHDVPIAGFIADNLRKVKLFMAHSHPSYIIAAWIGAGLLSKIGMAAVDVDKILGLNPLTATMDPSPETPYEFEHYKFEYKPLKDCRRDDPMYKKLIDQHYTAWSSGEYFPPVVD